MNQQAVLHAFSLLAEAKQLANHFWKNFILEEKENILTLTKAILAHDNAEDKQAALNAFELPNKQHIRRLTLLGLLLEEENTSSPHFIDIGLSLLILAQSTSQKELAQLFIKIDSAAESLWLEPEILSEIKTEKIHSLHSELKKVIAASYPLLSFKDKTRQLQYG